MSPLKRFIIAALTYAIVILGVMYWSGRATEKTLYNRFIINLEGVVINYSDYAQVVRFYKNILDFTPVVKKGDNAKQIIAFKLPGKRKLFLKQASASSEHLIIKQNTQNTIVLKVRNGFEKLHAKLRERTKLPQATKLPKDSPASRISPGQVSEILEQPWGKEFLTKDFDGNVLVFYRPRRRLSSMY